MGGQVIIYFLISLVWISYLILYQMTGLMEPCSRLFGRVLILLQLTDWRVPCCRPLIQDTEDCHLFKICRLCYYLLMERNLHTVLWSFTSYTSPTLLFLPKVQPSTTSATLSSPPPPSCPKPYSFPSISHSPSSPPPPIHPRTPLPYTKCWPCGWCLLVLGLPAE